MLQMGMCRPSMGSGSLLFQLQPLQEGGINRYIGKKDEVKCIGRNSKHECFKILPDLTAEKVERNLAGL